MLYRTSEIFPLAARADRRAARLLNKLERTSIYI